MNIWCLFISVVRAAFSSWRGIPATRQSRQSCKGVFKDCTCRIYSKGKTTVQRKANLRH